MRFWAQDADDVQALSALMQDAIVRLADMGADKARRRFALLANRFCWEQPSPPLRIRTAVRIDHVVRVECTGWPQAGSVLDLLALQCAMASDGLAASLTLPFAGGPALRIHVETLDIMLEDIGAAWPARRVPSHAV